MHEFSMTEELVRAVTEELDARKLTAPVREVQLKLGLFSGAVKEPLVFYYEMLTKEGRLAGSKLLVEEVPLRLKCRNCGRERDCEEALFLCEECGSSEQEITAGKEMRIESVVFEED